jgi:hypothetical protein
MTRVVLARRWLGACVLYACLSALVVASSRAPSTAQQTYEDKKCIERSGCLTTACHIESPGPFFYVCFQDYGYLYCACQTYYGTKCTTNENPALCGRRYIYDGLTCDGGECTGDLIGVQDFTDSDGCKCPDT